MGTRKSGETFAQTTGDLTVNGNLTMAAGKVIVADAGTAAAQAIQFRGCAVGTGFYSPSADTLIMSRTGASYVNVNSGGISMGNVTASSILLSFGLRLDATAIKTADYTVLTSDKIIIANGVGLTMTLPATPAGDQCVYFKNRDVGNLTIARNGNTIDGAAANLTLAAGQQALLYFESSGWIRIGA